MSQKQQANRWKIRGVELTKWLPNCNQPEEWFLAYMPFWVDEKGRRISVAGRWDDGHTKNAIDHSFSTFEEVEAAYNSTPQEMRVQWYDNIN